MPTRRMLLSSLAGLAAAGFARPAVAQAQDWPQRPVRIVVPYAPGGNTDAIARVMAQRLSEAFAQPFVIENRPGAGGALGAEAVARSPADGHTLFMAATPIIAVFPSMSKTQYDPVKDFAPISIVGTNPFVLVVHPSIPANDLGELVRYVKSQPNQVPYVVPSFGSLIHLSMALFVKRTGVEMIPVTYKGGGSLPLSDVIAGHVPIYFTSLSDVVPHADSGALKLLAVSSETRAPQIPNVPTFIEQGFPGFRIVTWNGLMAPAGTPKAIVDRIAAEVARAVQEPHLAQRLSGMGVDPLGNAPEQFAAVVASDIALWGEAVAVAGLVKK